MSFFRRFLDHEASSGVLLIMAALVALIMANTPAAPLYAAIIHFPQDPAASAPSHFSLLYVINDALMAVFFLMVGLEVKYELLKGALASRAKAAFPAIAALGGMVAPAVIYMLINHSEPANHDGWAIPAATDIAFALGVLALLGKRVPTSLKVFLLALAIIDDLGAIVIIALFYSHDLNLMALAGAAVAIGVLLVMNRSNVRPVGLYLLVGLVLWICVLMSGIHATLAGVVVGALIPLSLPGTDHSPGRALEHRLQPWVSYAVLPLFAFANAGISLLGVTPSHLVSVLPVGIAAGLVLGKPIGILLFTWGAIKLGLAGLPTGVNFRQIAAAAVLCGIGFTMSIFIATLAFGRADPEMIILAKMGILGGSLIAAVLGYALLRLALPLNQAVAGNTGERSKG